MRSWAAFSPFALIGRQVGLSELLEHLGPLFGGLLDFVGGVLRREVRIEPVVDQGFIEVGDVRLAGPLVLNAEPRGPRVHAPGAAVDDRSSQVLLGSRDVEHPDFKVSLFVVSDPFELAEGVLLEFRLGNVRRQNGGRLLGSDAVDDRCHLLMHALHAGGGRLLVLSREPGRHVLRELGVERVQIVGLTRLLDAVLEAVHVGAYVVARHERVEDVEIRAAQRVADIRDDLLALVCVVELLALLRREVAHYLFHARLLVVVPMHRLLQLVARPLDAIPGEVRDTRVVVVIPEHCAQGLAQTHRLREWRHHAGAEQEDDGVSHELGEAVQRTGDARLRRVERRVQLALQDRGCFADLVVNGFLLPRERRPEVLVRREHRLESLQELILLLSELLLPILVCLVVCGDGLLRVLGEHRVEGAGPRVRCRGDGVCRDGERLGITGG